MYYLRMTYHGYKTLNGSSHCLLTIMTSSSGKEQFFSSNQSYFKSNM